MKPNFSQLVSSLGIFLALFLLIMNSASAANLIEGLSHPESIAADSTGRIFVSNIGQKMDPTARDGDGFITELSAEGTLIHKFFNPKETLNAPKGLAVVGNVLYVADIDRIVGFNLQNSEQVFSLNLSAKTSFLNDLATIDEQTLLASASDTGTVYQISIPNRQFSVLPGHIPGANGISYDSKTKTIYVVGLGENFDGNGGIYKLAMAKPTAQFEQISVLPGFFDGVALVKDNQLIYSDWVGIQKPTPGTIKSYNTTTKKVDTLKQPVEFNGPADFFYQPKTNSLWIPLTLNNKIIILNMH
jgi:hypothetical protein